jgi:hypothetical protein
MFDEEIFIRALTTRPEDAKRFSQMFKPAWLNKSEYSPLLAEIYAFTRRTGEPPSCTTLHKIFQDKDSDAYGLRYKEAIDKVQSINPDRSEMIYTMEQAKGVAVTRSFLELSQEQSFIKKQMGFDGSGIIRDVQSWLTTFANSGEDRTMDIQQAIDSLLDTAEFMPTNVRIQTHIKPLDEWTGGGLRKKQTSIIIAPTGHGKSAMLLVIGHKIATIERKNVWIITNELPIEEFAERELSKLTGVEVEKIMDDPGIAYKGLDRFWKLGLQNRMRITEYMREVSTDEIEHEMGKMSNLYGWKPDVIILDYMERMRPSLSGYRRDKEWVWLGAVAKDLVRLAKKHNVLLWTAAQTNRSGLTATDIDMGMAQGSIQHLQESTAVFAMNQVDIPGTEKVAIKLKPIKMRQSKRAAKAVHLECDLSKMSITNMEADLNIDDEEEEDNKVLKTPLQKQRSRKRG